MSDANPLDDRPSACLPKEYRRALSKQLAIGLGPRMKMKRCEGCAGFKDVTCEGTMDGPDCWHPPGTIRVIDEKTA